MKSVIQVNNLNKSYGENNVLNKLSFNVRNGEIFGLLGVNGAGKTTTLECIEGLRTYEDGQISVDGKLGVQLQSSSLPDNIKVSESLTLFSKWNDTNLDNDFAERIGLREIYHRQYMELSTGQKRKLHLTLAIIGSPDIIILDEPTAGLDVESRVALHEEIRKLHKEGKTIIIASHDMAEIENLCDRIGILKDGNFAFIGTTEELITKIDSSYEIQVKYSENVLYDNLESCDYKGVYQEYSVYEVSNIQKGLLELLNKAANAEVEVIDVKIMRQSLENLFIKIAKGEQ